MSAQLRFGSLAIGELFGHAGFNWLILAVDGMDSYLLGEADLSISPVVLFDFESNIFQNA